MPLDEDDGNDAGMVVVDGDNSEYNDDESEDKSNDEESYDKDESNDEESDVDSEGAEIEVYSSCTEPPGKSKFHEGISKTTSARGKNILQITQLDPQAAKEQKNVTNHRKTRSDDPVRIKK